jgi:hypothetical protein
MLMTGTCKWSISKHSTSPDFFRTRSRTVNTMFYESQQDAINFGFHTEQRQYLRVIHPDWVGRTLDPDSDSETPRNGRDGEIFRTERRQYLRGIHPEWVGRICWTRIRTWGLREMGETERYFGRSGDNVYKEYILTGWGVSRVLVLRERASHILCRKLSSNS